jgi:hypothetical protein
MIMLTGEQLCHIPSEMNEVHVSQPASLRSAGLLKRTSHTYARFNTKAMLTVTEKLNITTTSVESN